MTTTLRYIWRYPIKGIGAEQLDHVTLQENRPLPLDRAWAVLEQGGDETTGWRSCRNFLRGAKGPELMAITAAMTETVLTVSHPKKADLQLDLDAPNTAEFFEWLSEIYPTNRAPAAHLVKAPDEGLADVPFPSVSILNLASLRALSQKAGRDLDPRRFRGNLWLDGLAPWEEFDLIGKTLTIGDATLSIKEPITRCRATEANPDTGNRDTPTLQLLEQGWGHTDFGIYATVTSGGTIKCGDEASVA